MKTIILFLIAIACASCATKNLPPDTTVVKWKGKNTLVMITDTTGGEHYQPVYLKHKLF